MEFRFTKTNVESELHGSLFLLTIGLVFILFPEMVSDLFYKSSNKSLNFIFKGIWILFGVFLVGIAGISIVKTTTPDNIFTLFLLPLLLSALCIGRFYKTKYKL